MSSRLIMEWKYVQTLVTVEKTNKSLLIFLEIRIDIPISFFYRIKCNLLIDTFKFICRKITLHGNKTWFDKSNWIQYHIWSVWINFNKGVSDFPDRDPILWRQASMTSYAYRLFRISSHCLYLDLNDQKTRRYFGQWFHT